MKSGGKTLLRVGAFWALLGVILVCLCSFFQPVWLRWNNYNTTKGFYEEPKNTIENIFLGSSVISGGISPMEMYDDYGINAFNFGMAEQPFACSYYWLEEAYRLHPETLKNVVVDASSLRSGAGKSYYHRAYDNMKLSSVKIRAVYDYMDGDIGSTISFMNPIVSYHTRWKSLESTDFEKYSYDPDNGARGYYLIKTFYAEKSEFTDESIKNPVLDPTAEPKELLEDSLHYFDRMVKFCEERDLNLLLIKTSAKNWDSSLHVAVQELADSYGVEFLDFNYDPLFSLGGSYIHEYDTNDGRHLNYFGAVKLSKWLGKYLVENYGAADVRDNPKYDFMKAQLEEYNTRVRQDISLISCETLQEYLELASNEDNTVFISVKEEAAAGLTDSDREFLKEFGLEKLAELENEDSYIGIISGGKVLKEKVKAHSNTKNKNSIVLRGTLDDGTAYTVRSGSVKHGDMASITVNRQEQDKIRRGLNISVYSHKLDEIVSSVTFDTHESTARDCYGLNSTNILLDEDALSKEYDPTSVRGRIVYFKQYADAFRKEATK